VPDAYDPNVFAELAELEPHSWWFRTRNRLIVDTVRRHFPDARDVLEIGTGTGYTLQALSDALPAARLTGTELFAEGLEIARERMPSARFDQLDARDMPFSSAFDLVGAFDVLEHIDNDTAALRGIARALRPGAGLIVTVPQHPALWSEADTFAHHERRYRRHELVERLRATGFDVIRVTSFVTLLSPLMLASRLRGRFSREFDPLSEFRIPQSIDRTFERVALLEQRLLRTGASLPFGGSLLAVARRDG
jgi:SAM-dependent methyltransferase